MSDNRTYLQSKENNFILSQQKDIRILLWDKLLDVLDDKQKEIKIRNLLASLKKQSIIVTSSSNQQKSYWVLKE